MPLLSTCVPSMSPLCHPLQQTTPLLLDKTAASPSMVYGMHFTQTPYRQMAALPMDQAVAAPLVDSSPFMLDDVDTLCLADEAKRVVQSLAPAMMGA